MDRPPPPPADPARPYAEAYYCARAARWKYRLSAAGRAACAAYVDRHPRPFAWLRAAAPGLADRLARGGDLRDEATAAMLAAVPDAFLRYDPARGTEEAYVRNWVLSAARTADRLYGVEPEAGRRADPPDAPGFDPPAPAADPPDAAAVGPAVRARCSAREWAVLDAYYGVSGGPGDGTARHVPALAALLAVPQAEFAGILKATMTRLRAELREE